VSVDADHNALAAAASGIHARHPVALRVHDIRYASAGVDNPGF
jgi:hypothetical protein